MAISQRMITRIILPRRGRSSPRAFAIPDKHFPSTIENCDISNSFSKLSSMIHHRPRHSVRLKYKRLLLTKQEERDKEQKDSGIGWERRGINTTTCISSEKENCQTRMNKKVIGEVRNKERV